MVGMGKAVKSRCQINNWLRCAGFRKVVRKKKGGESTFGFEEKVRESVGGATKKSIAKTDYERWTWGNAKSSCGGE